MALPLFGLRRCCDGFLRRIGAVEETAELVGHAIARSALHPGNEWQRYDGPDDGGSARDVRAYAARGTGLL